MGWGATPSPWDPPGYHGYNKWMCHNGQKTLMGECNPAENSPWKHSLGKHYKHQVWGGHPGGGGAEGCLYLLPTWERDKLGQVGRMRWVINGWSLHILSDQVITSMIHTSYLLVLPSPAAICKHCFWERPSWCMHAALMTLGGGGALVRPTEVITWINVNNVSRHLVHSKVKLIIG